LLTEENITKKTKLVLKDSEVKRHQYPGSAKKHGSDTEDHMNYCQYKDENVQLV
jgi:hypothetical protein